MAAPRFPFFRPPEGALPPEDVVITELRGEPDTDGKRVRVFLAVTPFQQPPHVTVALSQHGGEELAFSTIIEPAIQQVTFVMHAKPPLQSGIFTLEGTLTYPNREISRTLRSTGTFHPGIDL